MTEDQTGPLSDVLKLAGRDRNSEIDFELRPNAEQCAAIAVFLGIEGAAKLRFTGTVSPYQDGWKLSGNLGATVTQACVVTLAPVKTRIETHVSRRYLPMTEEEAEALDLDPEAEDDLEPLADSINLGAVLVEELALALPPYPRVAEADLAAFAEQEGIALDGEKENPFAALAALRDKLDGEPR